jgi:hypothetical protein
LGDIGARERFSLQQHEGIIIVDIGARERFSLQERVGIITNFIARVKVLVAAILVKRRVLVINATSQKK